MNLPIQISDWLKRESLSDSADNLTVTVGVGCNSETTIISDDKVSVHAAIFAGILKKEAFNQNAEDGYVFLVKIHDSDDFSVNTEKFKVEPYEVFKAVNDSSWEVRFKSGLVSQIKSEMKLAGKNETGGVLIGVVNHKTNTIHVTGLVPAPLDSNATPVCFFRGHQGLPEEIQRIEEGSGGQLGYVGEWHSHPHGPNGLSEVDMASVRKFKAEFDALVTPLPVFLMVVTLNEILPFVF